MVRLKIAYWEFDFEAVCPTLDHDLLSQAHIPITVSVHCHHQNGFRIKNKMGSDESHFNVSVGSDGQSHKTVSTSHNLLLS